MGKDAREKLIEFLEYRAFRPVLRANPADYPEGQRGKLKTLQQKTEAELRRFRSYRSAREVLSNFRRDLRSAAARPVHEALDALELPTINEVRDDFERLAGELGVED